jgi:hypothetical protein
MIFSRISARAAPSSPFFASLLSESAAMTDMVNKPAVASTKLPSKYRINFSPFRCEGCERADSSQIQFATGDDEVGLIWFLPIGEASKR